jgi:hypothetical protein
MNASKENCEIAQSLMNTLSTMTADDAAKAGDFIHEFFAAAKAKLPSEAAFEREKNKRQRAKQGGG